MRFTWAISQSSPWSHNVLMWNDLWQGWHQIGCFIFTKRLNPTERKLDFEVWALLFFSFVLLYRVFVAHGLTGQQSALLSGLQSRLVVDALALGFNPRGGAWALQLLITVRWKCWDCSMSPGIVRRDPLSTTSKPIQFHQQWAQGRKDSLI